MDSPGQIFPENQVFRGNSSASSMHEAEHSKLVLGVGREGGLTVAGRMCTHG